MAVGKEQELIRVEAVVRNLKEKEKEKGDKEMSLKRLFKFHKVNEFGQQKAELIAELYQNFYEKLFNILEVEGEFIRHIDDVEIENRHIAMIDNKLEEACFYSKKIIANREENTETN